MAKTVLVTGASAGIGKATAILLAQNGYNVYGAARRTEKMRDLKEYGIQPIKLDITNDGSILACVDQIFREAGTIDILVNNAGFGTGGAIEDVSIEDARYQLEVNVFGAMRLTQLVLPKMRENKYGKIVNISSIGGKVAFPLAGWYHASKIPRHNVVEAQYKASSIVCLSDTVLSFAGSCDLLVICALRLEPEIAQRYLCDLKTRCRTYVSLKKDFVANAH